MSKTIHVVPHQHFDLVWRRTASWYSRRRQELLSQMLDMFGRHPGFTFTLSQASVLREFLEKAPSRKTEVVRLLGEGRLEIIGGSETLCDQNLCSGVAILRNIESGLRWFSDELGYRVEIGSFEDAFGVNAQLPAMLQQAGYRFFKASRMPFNGIEGIHGDFRWEGLDGSVVRCVAPLAPNSDWGWGFPDNPDEPLKPTPTDRKGKIRTSLRRAIHTDAEHVLFVVMGEEQDIFDGIVELLYEMSAETAVPFVFSTFSRYYATISAAQWDAAPLIPKQTDLSRLFTACYTTRTESKQTPRSLEHRLLGAEMTDALVTTHADGNADAWRTLFRAQFHDAICGCHIAENARQLRRLTAKAMTTISARTSLVPWRPSVPRKPLRLKRLRPPYDGQHDVGSRTVMIENGRLKTVTAGGKSLDALCRLSLREDHGTLWTEEYSGRRYVHAERETVIGVAEGPDALAVTVGGTAPAFRTMWPGFARLAWRRTLTFHRRSDFIAVDVELEFIGCATEISLRWESDDLHSCVAEIPFGSVERRAHTPAADTMVGDAFPVLNWVSTAGFAVFNQGTPGHAIRDGRLETILLRSPVKRWSPWFPVTPDQSCWENGRRRFSFLWLPVGANTSNADLHRSGFEFNLGTPIEQATLPCLAGLPPNVVVASMRRAEDRAQGAGFRSQDTPAGHQTRNTKNGIRHAIEMTVFEADGIPAAWNAPRSSQKIEFKPRAIQTIKTSY